MDPRQLENLLERYITGELSPGERSLLVDLIGQPGQEETLDRFARQVMLSNEFAATDQPGVKDAILAHLDAAMHAGRGVAGTRGMADTRRIPIIRYAAAAAVLLFLVAGIWLWRSGSKEQPAIAKQSVHDVAPGREGAVLTLADGRQIVLDSTDNGSLARQGTTSITKQNAGQLTYSAENIAAAEIMYNTLSTPRGRRTSVVLSDGTRVWLNAMSSIKFPTAFGKGGRSVEVMGEAFFEVAKDPSRPFTVKILSQQTTPLEIAVLGTSFNITAYADEDTVSTTLIDGSVRMTSGSSVKLMTPGQQLVAKSDGRLEIHADADVQKITAWKDGKFLFRSDELASIMKQLSRWYDIDVHFDGAVADHYTGKISRQVNISQVLKMLEAAGGVKFSVLNKEVKVLPKTM